MPVQYNPAFVHLFIDHLQTVTIHLVENQKRKTVTSKMRLQLPLRCRRHRIYVAELDKVSGSLVQGVETCPRNNCQNRGFVKFYLFFRTILVIKIRIGTPNVVEIGWFAAEIKPILIWRLHTIFNYHDLSHFDEILCADTHFHPPKVV